jgi:DNA-binding response OmpR family regulator
MFGQATLREAEQAAPRILVIDADNLHRMIICRAAANAGYIPAGAATFEMAAKLLQGGAFDCITLDLSLGGHAGADILRHLRFVDYKAPILFVGGDEAACRETLRVARSLSLNVGAPVPKPVDVAMLRHWLERLRTESALERDHTPVSA